MKRAYVCISGIFLFFQLSDMERKHNALLGAIRKEIEHTERTVGCPVER